jgi:choline dehydrogenase-like flavoprotein
MSREDVTNLSRGFAHMCRLLLAAGAEVVYPATFGIAPVRSDADARVWLERDLPWADLALQTVHVFSSCPIGERPERCAADSFGRVRGVTGLSINDASMLPDSPGVNNQATTMAMARRRLAFLHQPARSFIEACHARTNAEHAKIAENQFLCVLCELLCARDRRREPDREFPRC